METQLLVVLYLGLGGVVDDEVGLEVLQLLSCRTDEHVGDEVGLPCHLDDEADGHARVLVGTAESIDDVEVLVAELLHGQVLDGLPDLLAHRVVVVLILLGSPPNGVLGVLVHDDVLILGGTAGVDTSLYVYSAELSVLTNLVALKASLGLLFEELLVRRIVGDHGRASDAVLSQNALIKLCHCFVNVI